MIDAAKIDWARIDAESSLHSAGDRELETLCQLGAAWSLNGRTIPAFRLGHVPLLLLVESPLMRGGRMSDDDCLRALAILINGEACASMLLAERHLGEPLFSTACIAVRDEVIGGACADYDQIRNMLCNIFNASMRAFEFLGGHKEGDDCASAELDAKWFAWIAGECARRMNDSVERVMWFYPLGAVAFAFIDALEDMGRRVARPVDDRKQLDALKRQVEEMSAA